VTWLNFGGLVCEGTAKIKVWSIVQGDKANAWNQYVHRIWAGEQLAFFVDGYVRLNRDAVRLLGNAVAADGTVLGGTGIPSMGRTAPAIRKQMLEVGGFHGNFCCIKGEAISQMRQRQIALPVGLYRVDSLMGALLSFGLHPETQIWDHKRILVHPDASWLIDPKKWWRPAEIRGKIKQILRQSRGALENRAVTDHFVARLQLAETLPKTVQELVLFWIDKTCSSKIKKSIMRHPLTKHAVKELRDMPPPNGINLNAVLISDQR